MSSEDYEREEWQVLAHSKSGEEIDTGSPLGKNFALSRYETHVEMGSSPTLRRRTRTVTYSEWETVATRESARLEKES